MRDGNWFNKLNYKVCERKLENQKKRDEAYRKEMKKKGITYINQDLHRYHDSIYTMGNTEATILYIAVMLGGVIFKDRLLIWVFATFIYYMHITRHNRR